MNQKLTVVLTDLHGCFYTMIRLLNQCPKGANLVFAGDLIDRGQHSRKVVEFAMEHQIPTCMGNHEDLALAFHNGRRAKCKTYYDHGVWLMNGGREALENWRPEGKYCSIYKLALPDKVLTWMESLPPYLYPSNEVDENGRRLLVSHTGYGLDADKNNWFRALWGRYQYGDGEFVYEEGTGKPIDDMRYRVFGHSSNKQAIVTNTYANIDSGAAYTERGFGNMTAFIWPTKQLVVQQYDESFVEPNFVIQDGCIV